MMEEPQEKRKYYTWSEEDLRKALRDLKNKTVGLNECSRRYGIPKPTIIRHLKKQSDKICKGRPTIFSKTIENELAKHILEMEQCMFGLTASDVRRLAFQIAEKNGIQHNFNKQKEMAGKSWFYKFMGRHPELSLRQPEATSINRARGFNRENVMDFYEKLEKIVDDTGITANNVFNVDETGISTVQKRTQKVIGQRGKKQVGSIASGERGVNTTAVCAVSASGQFIPPMIIFKRKRMCPQLRNGAPPGSIVTVSDTGYINTELFVTWLKHFIEIVKPSKEKKVILLLDGHTTHSKNLEAIKIARENGIILLQLPGHTTHKLQPLDVAVFGPLGTYYIQEVETWMRANTGKPVTQYEVAQLFNQAYQRAATVGNAVSAFKATGIWPVNRHIFEDHHFLAAETFQSQNDMNEVNNITKAVLATTDKMEVSDKNTLNLSQFEDIIKDLDEINSNGSDVTECESPSLFESNSDNYEMISEKKFITDDQVSKREQPERLLTTVLNYFNCIGLTSAQPKEVNLPENNEGCKTNNFSNSKVDIQSKTMISKYQSEEICNKTVNLGASTSRQLDDKITLKFPIDTISPKPMNKQRNSRKRGLQKTVVLTASPYKTDLEQAIEKRIAKLPKIKLEESIKKKKNNVTKRDCVRRNIKKPKKYDPETFVEIEFDGDDKEDKPKSKSKTKDIQNKTPKTRKNQAEKSIIPKKKEVKPKKKRGVRKNSETDSSTEDDNVIILDDDSDVDIEEELDDNYCSICHGYYYDKKGPKVDWIECVRCHKWLHITCSDIPDICPKCLQ